MDAAPRAALSLPAALALGTLAVGTLDGLDALVFFGLRGVPPVRVLQSIASGLLGPAAFQGGGATAALGVLLHFLIAAGVVSTYVLASRRLPALAGRPWLLGPLYGLAVFAVMYGGVLPLSAASARLPAGVVLLNALLIHALGVGLPSALAAWAAHPRGPLVPAQPAPLR